MIKKRFFVFIFALLIMASYSAAGFAGLAADMLLEKAVQYYKEGDIEEALKFFKKILIVEPQNNLAAKYIDMIEGEVVYSTKSEISPVVTYELEEAEEASLKDNRDEVISKILSELEEEPDIKKEEYNRNYTFGGN